MSGRDFWLSSGYRLLERDGNGHLLANPAYMAAYWRRPEVAPVAESCAAERALHAALEADPMRAVSEAELAGLADPDAADNYRAVLRFRDFLREHRTLEAAYLRVARQGGVAFPPLFVDHMAHVILRAALDGATDPFRVRAAELFFRPQRVTLKEGSIMLADQAGVDLEAHGAGGLETGGQPATIDIDVLTEEWKDAYWARSDGFDTAIDIAFTLPGLDGLCRAIEAWLRHLLGLTAKVSPMRRIDDERWVWHIGLDRDANDILNALYKGETVDEARLRQILALFRLEIADRAALTDAVAGRPIYLGLAMTKGGTVQMKPQNLIANLPLKARS
jgi:hypothetical protein